MSDLHKNLADNIRKLREAHGMSQQRMSQLSGIPRPTWASLESGSANPTLGVLSKAATALQVSIEELVGAPRTDVQLIRAADVKVRKRQGAEIRPLIPDSINGLEITRVELVPNGRFVGVPHTPGTREYLTCEKGKCELIASGEHWLLEEGDMLVFRGDQRHSYHNPDSRKDAVAISVVCFA